MLPHPTDTFTLAIIQEHHSDSDTNAFTVSHRQRAKFLQVCPQPEQVQLDERSELLQVELQGLGHREGLR